MNTYKHTDDPTDPQTKPLEAVGGLFSNYQLKRTKIVNERQYIISLFVEEINKERPCSFKVNGKTRKLGKIDARGIALKLSHIPTIDLYYILSSGKDYKNRHGSFSKYFFGALKVSPPSSNHL